MKLEYSIENLTSICDRAIAELDLKLNRYEERRKRYEEKKALLIEEKLNVLKKRWWNRK